MPLYLFPPKQLFIIITGKSVEYMKSRYGRPSSHPAKNKGKVKESTIDNKISKQFLQNGRKQIKKTIQKIIFEKCGWKKTKVYVLFPPIVEGGATGEGAKRKEEKINIAKWYNKHILQKIDLKRVIKG